MSPRPAPSGGDGAGRKPARTRGAGTRATTGDGTRAPRSKGRRAAGERTDAAAPAGAPEPASAPAPPVGAGSGFNAAVAQRLEQISRLMELLGADRFKAIAHSRAARIVDALHTDLSVPARAGDRAALMALEGIGERIADKIIEFAQRGTMTELEELAAQVPPGLLALTDIPGLGPKTARVLWKDGGVTDMAGLKRIIADGSILRLPRMGEKAVEKLKSSIALAEEGGRRLWLGLAAAVGERFVDAMRAVPGVVEAAYAGSLRRGRETVGDIDVLVAVRAEGAALRASEAFRALPEVERILAGGEGRASVRAFVDPRLGRWKLEGAEGDEVPDSGARRGPTIQVDLKVVPEASWGAALLYFTGSKDHNVRLRERALRMGLTLNEYGLFPEDRDDDTPPQQRGVKPVASRTEADVYKALGFSWIPPELREDRGELTRFEIVREPARAPKGGTRAPQAPGGGAGAPDQGAPGPLALVDLADIRAELHAHTTASDGELSIEQLAEHARRRGFHTIAVTDHSQSSAIAGGLTVKRLLAHVEAVRAAAARTTGIAILAGSEVDILADGRLDYEDAVLRELDVVVASPHAALSQEPAAATARLVRAIRNRYVNVLGHPTGRLINRRAGLSPDMAAVIGAAREEGVALEINAHWMRLDLRDVHVRAATEAGCLIAIDCDVHEPSDFDNLRFGVMMGRRGWLPREACVNTWDRDRLHQWLKSRR